MFPFATKYSLKSFKMHRRKRNFTNFMQTHGRSHDTCSLIKAHGTERCCRWSPLDSALFYSRNRRRLLDSWIWGKLSSKQWRVRHLVAVLPWNQSINQRLHKGGSPKDSICSTYPFRAKARGSLTDIPIFCHFFLGKASMGVLDFCVSMLKSQHLTFGPIPLNILIYWWVT